MLFSINSLRAFFASLPDGRQALRFKLLFHCDNFRFLFFRSRLPRTDAYRTDLPVHFLYSPTDRMDSFVIKILPPFGFFVGNAQITFIDHCGNDLRCQLQMCFCLRHKSPLKKMMIEYCDCQDGVHLSGGLHLAKERILQ